MKKLFASKISALVASLMILSALVPVLAFASAKIANVSYDSTTGKVTGAVYVTNDTYKNTLNNGSVPVAVYVYGANATSASYTTNAVYAGTGYYTFEYNVSDVPCSTYSTLYSVSGEVYKSGVTGDVYQFPTSTQCGFGGGFPGGFGGVIDSNGNVDANQLTNLFATDKNPTITSTSDVVMIPASALANGETLTIKLEDGTSITLPIAALKLDDLAKSLGVELSGLTIRVELKALTGDDAAAVTSAVYGIGAKPLATPVDFKIVAVGNGKEQQVNDLGVYFKRTLPVVGAVENPDSVTGVVYNPETKEFSFVPSTFATEDGDTIATLLRNSTSIYTVIQLDNVSFKDIATHWAKADIETLASKLIVEGTGANKFEPQRNITRAEFAALVVRSLGLEATGSSKFPDVSSSKWYAGVVATAADAGLVQGDEKGKFNPNAYITRKEVSAIVVRALKYAGKDISLTSDADVSAALAAFTDTNTLGWAKAEVAAAVKSGIVLGQSATKVAGNSNATRAEAVTMIIRYLGDAGFINS